MIKHSHTQNGSKAQRAPSGTRSKPGTIEVRLNQIHIKAPLGQEYCWLERMRYANQSVPAVKAAALDILQLIQPMVVVKDAQESVIGKSQSYTLLAGHRTYQLMLEQRARDHKVQVFLLPDDRMRDADDLLAADFFVGKLVHRLAAEDAAIMGAALMDNPTLRARVNKYFDVDSDTAIARLFGMSRASFHRVTKPARQAAKRANSEPARVGFEFDLPDMEVPGEAG